MSSQKHCYVSVPVYNALKHGDWWELRPTVITNFYTSPPQDFAIFRLRPHLAILQKTMVTCGHHISFNISTDFEDSTLLFENFYSRTSILELIFCTSSFTCDLSNTGQMWYNFPSPAIFGAFDRSHWNL